MLVFPLVMPTNMDLLFFTFAVFFYGYGTYLHWGYEFDWPDAHHPFLNTSFQHYLHDARSTLHKPLHTGFFFKFWDRIWGSVADGECACAKCCVARGERLGQDRQAGLLRTPSTQFLVERRPATGGKNRASAESSCERGAVRPSLPRAARGASGVRNRPKAPLPGRASGRTR
jgi:lathosterol oxidase